MIHYCYGKGKGKTSAAAGACLRALGHGMKCAYAQFHKNGSSGEVSQLRKLGADVYDAGEVRFMRDMSDEEISRMTDRHNDELRSVMHGYDLIVLDELGDAVRLGTVDISLVREVLSCGAEVIVTGHDTVPLFMDADYITRFEDEAHPYRKGIKARKGIEY